MKSFQNRASHRLLFSGFVCLALCLVGLPLTSAKAATVNVSSYSDLVSAISTVASGDTIALTTDITLGAGEFINLTNKNLTLTSANPLSPVTIKRSSALNDAPMIHIASGSASITITNLTLDGGAVWDKHGDGAVNSGVHSQYSIINSLAGNEIILGANAIIQNNEVNFGNWGGKCAGGGIFAQGTKLTIDGGVVRYNCANGTGNDGGGITSAIFAHGGGVCLTSSSAANASLTMISGSISDNWCKQPFPYNNYGGNVEAWRFNTGTVAVEIRGGEISRGYAGQAGGLYLNGVDFLMTGGKVDGNACLANGGGILMRPYSAAYPGTFSMTGGEVTNNKTIGDGAGAGYGGGLYLERVANTASISGVTFSGNESKEGGGAIGMVGGTAEIKGSTSITGNTANGWAGGIYLSVDPATMAGGMLTLDGTTELSGNTSVANPLSNGIYHGGASLTLASDTLDVTDYTWLRQASTNYVTLITPLTSGEYKLATDTTDSADGRIVVKPGGTLTTAADYAAYFSHNVKGIIPDGNNLVLGSFDVTFDLQGYGSPIPSQALGYGAKVTKPADPVATNLVFGGWYKDAACTVQWLFDTDVVTSDLVLFAKWGSAPTPTPAPTPAPTPTPTASPVPVIPPKTGDYFPTMPLVILICGSLLLLLWSINAKRKRKN